LRAGRIRRVAGTLLLARVAALSFERLQSPLPWLIGPLTVLLGTSPGGIAEMCITAKVMQLGVPVATAFHVTRYLAVLLATAPLYRWLRQRGG
jgi:uncharacterized protein